MTDPTFHLEGIVRSRDETTDFEGPLTLILQLLSKNKVEIRDISISEILDQYLEFLSAMDENDLETASEFVAMASHLVYIKTKMLLATGEEEVTELEELISSLEQLKNKETSGRIKAVVPELFRLYRVGAGFLTKQPEPLPTKREYVYSHDRGDLLKALLRIFEKTDGDELPVMAEKQIVPSRIAYSVEDKSKEIRELLSGHGVMRMEDLIRLCKSRSEAVAAFIAVLQLCREGQIFLTGSDEDPLLTARKETDGEENQDGAM